MGLTSVLVPNDAHIEIRHGIARTFRILWSRSFGEIK